MGKVSAEFAIIGAGPAGSHLASRLAAGGRECLMFDPKGAWEKPCGGGVPTRAIREFAFLLENSNYPHKLIDRITMISPIGRKVSLKLDRPFAIYSRKVLNGLVLDRALEAGAEFVRAGVTAFERVSDGWSITTSDGREWRAKFLIGADGAASFTRRRLVGIFPMRDLALAFGYNVAEEAEELVRPGNGGLNGSPGPDTVVVRFPSDFTGYLWAFPRPGVMNFGVAAKLGERSSDELRALLSGFVQDFYGGRMPDPARVTFFGAKIPTLDLAAWKDLRAVGDGWALVGDAAGFCDPITGEGIFYAFKSADLLADALLAGEESESLDGNYDRSAALYERLWRESFGRELEHASYRLPQFYHGHFFGHVFTDAVVRLAKHHRGVRTVLINALIGEQSYVTLKRDLLRRAYQFF
ncbi:MAG TPA: NAD(P)/FAD-dependent oxidoreductase [Blastocatellia bacterium]|nr:NAD(P)/FAD-dependent oxidoreductase [Blastocatellia bacterium]